MGDKFDKALQRLGYALAGVALLGALIFPGLQLLALSGMLAFTSSQIGK